MAESLSDPQTSFDMKDEDGNDNNNNENLNDKDETVQIILRAGQEEPGGLDMIFVVPKRVVGISDVIKTAINDSMSTNYIIDKPPVAVDRASLGFIIDYMMYHQGVEPATIAKPLNSTDMTKVCADKWDADFIDTVCNVRPDHSALYDLIKVANYLGMQKLLELGCAKVASMIKYQPVQDVQNILNGTHVPRKAQ